jgi:hypothetical protein
MVSYVCDYVDMIMLKLSLNTVERHGMIFHLLNFIRNTNVINMINKCESAYKPMSQNKCIIENYSYIVSPPWLLITTW